MIIGKMYQGGEYRPVNEKGEITRQGQINFSGQWKILSVRKVQPFGRLGNLIKLAAGRGF